MRDISCGISAFVEGTLWNSPFHFQQRTPRTLFESKSEILQKKQIFNLILPQGEFQFTTFCSFQVLLPSWLHYDCQLNTEHNTDLWIMKTVWGHTWHIGTCNTDLTNQQNTSQHKNRWSVTNDLMETKTRFNMWAKKFSLKFSDTCMLLDVCYGFRTWPAIIN